MANLIDTITASRVWKSFFRHGWPDTEMNRSLVMTSNIFFHLHPVKVSLRSIRATYTWGLGALAVIMFVILTVTFGLVLAGGCVWGQVRIDDFEDVSDWRGLERDGSIFMEGSASGRWFVALRPAVRLGDQRRTRTPMATTPGGWRTGPSSRWPTERSRPTRYRAARTARPPSAYTPPPLAAALRLEAEPH